jgi:hypothetical protein
MVGGRKEYVPHAHSTSGSRENIQMKQICVIGGMPRASTTFLYHTLALHPNAFVPARKETEYFSLNFDRGPEWYETFFRSMPHGSYGFDISPMYFFSPEATQRIADHFKDPRIILIIREPVGFSFSFYRNRKFSGMKIPSIEGFLQSFQYQKDGCSLEISLEPGRIIEAIRRFQRVFKNDLLMIDYKEVEQNATNVLTAIENFLGLPKYFTDDNFENIRINSSQQKEHPIINRLMHQKWFADSITLLVPKRIIMAVRYYLQRPPNPNATTETSDVERRFREIAARHFEFDTAGIEAIFAGGGFTLGSGTQFQSETPTLPNTHEGRT